MLRGEGGARDVRGPAKWKLRRGWARSQTRIARSAPPKMAKLPAPAAIIAGEQVGVSVGGTGVFGLGREGGGEDGVSGRMAGRSTLREEEDQVPRETERWSTLREEEDAYSRASAVLWGAAAGDQQGRGGTAPGVGRCLWCSKGIGAVSAPAGK